MTDLKRWDPSEERWSEIAKVTRAIIRLKWSLAADRELRAKLPDMKDAFNAAVQRGEFPDSIDIHELAEGVINDAGEAQDS